jgi:hypothetical protein
MAGRLDKGRLAASLFAAGVMGVVIPLAKSFGVNGLSFWGALVGMMALAAGWVSVIMIMREGRRQNPMVSLGLSADRQPARSLAVRAEPVSAISRKWFDR